MAKNNMAMFNMEYLASGGGDFEEIKSYCMKHSCSGKNRFGSKEDCISYRDGKCKMLEFMKMIYGKGEDESLV